jgi:hypothetical protein
MTNSAERELLPCQECGMPVAAGEYHPYAACLMFHGCHGSEVVRANLSSVVRAQASGVPDGDYEQFAQYVERNYNGTVVFFKPRWHAEKLWRAAKRALFAIPTPPKSASVPVERLEALREVWGSSANERYAIGGEFCSGEAHVYEVCEEDLAELIAEYKA